MMRGSKLLGWAAKLLKPLADYSRATAPVLAWFRGDPSCGGRRTQAFRDALAT